MAPTGSRTRASRPKTARKARRTTIVKKPAAAVVKPKQKIKKPKKMIQKTPPPSSPSKTGSIDFEAVDVVSATSSPCSTPKAQRFRLPQIVSCPPAPNKPRMSSTCLFRRSPIAFFAPPDLELFFYYANRGISV